MLLKNSQKYIIHRKLKYYHLLAKRPDADGKKYIFSCRLLFTVNVILTSLFLTLRTRFIEFLPKWRGVFPIKRQS